MTPGLSLARMRVTVLAVLMELRCKRAYDTPEAGDGFRVLVDRLWPRGLAKADAKIDLWAKECAPSTELRHAWHAAESDAAYAACADRYRGELAGSDALAELATALRGKKVVTLVFAVRDVAHTHARVLAEVLEGVL